MQAEGRGRTPPTLVIIAGLATAGLGFALARGWEPGIRGEWVWRRNDLPVRLWMAAAAGIALVAAVALLCRGGRWERMSPAAKAAGLALLVLCAFACQLGLLNAIGPPWISPALYILSPNVTTYFQVSLDVQSPCDWLRHYPELLPALPYHAATHPPGFTLFFLGVREAVATRVFAATPLLRLIVDTADALGMRLTMADAVAAIAGALFIALIGAGVVVPVYLLTRLLASERAALYAACLAAGMPGLLLLGASPDLLIVTLAAAALCRSYLGYRGSVLSAGLAGLVIAVGLFCTFGFAAVAAWVGLWAAVGVARSPHRAAATRAALRTGVIAAAAFVALYLALYLVCGYRPIEVAMRALSAHRGVTTIETARSYWQWALMNPVECALFAGLPLALAALWSAWALRGAEHARLRDFLLAWLCVVLLLDLSGVVRGEVGRIWLFLLWPAAVAAGAALAPRADGARVTALLVLMQVTQALMMKGYLTIYSIL